VNVLSRKLLRDISLQKTQFIAVAVTVFLGITMFGASYDSFQNLQASYDATATQTRFANLTVTGGDIPSFVSFAEAQSGVESIETRTVVDLPFGLSNTRLLGRVVGIPDSSEVNLLSMQSGSEPAPGETVLEAHLADHFELGAGSTVSLLGPDGWMDVPVSGVAASPEYIWPAKSRQEVLTTPDNFGVVFVPEMDARRLAGVEEPNQAVVYYRDGEPNDGLTATLTSAAADAVDVFTRADQPSNSALEEDLTGFEELSVFFPILFLTASGMAGYVMITRLVQAQRPQIGIMLANGFTRRTLLRHYLGYGLVPGVAGAIPGAIAGSLLARLITGYYTDIISVPVTLVETHPMTALVAVMLGVGASLLAALGPALTASRITPAESMRGFAPVGGGRPSIIERIVPAAGRMPIRWRMGLRGIERNPRRTTSTILGVVLSLILVLVSWGMIDTIQQLMNLQFDRIETQDARVYFDGPVDDTAISALTGVDGVAGAERSAQVPASVASGSDVLSTAVIVLPADTTMHGFFDAHRDPITFDGSGALVSQGLLDSTGAVVGGDLQVTVAGLGSIDVPVAGVVDEPLGSFVYMTFDTAEALTGIGVPATAALISYDGSAEADTIRQAILDLPNVAAFEDTEALAEMMRGFMGLFYAFVGVMLAFGAAMAFALIFNSMSVNIAERTREVGTLMAVGVDRSTVSRLITVENLAVVLIGVPIGLVAGYWVSAAALASFESDMFRLTLDMRPSTLALSALAMVIVAFLSQRPGLTAIRRMDLTRIIKDRSS
jgi:putative ABC transport system permease protein